MKASAVVKTVRTQTAVQMAMLDVTISLDLYSRKTICIISIVEAVSWPVATTDGLMSEPLGLDNSNSVGDDRELCLCRAAAIGQETGADYDTGFCDSEPRAHELGDRELLIGRQPIRHADRPDGALSRKARRRDRRPPFAQ